MRTKRVKTSPFDVADYLKTAKDRAAYLEACAEQSRGDVAFLAKALGDVARARGMTRVAREAGVTRESLYRSLSAAGNPELATVLRVAKSLGVRLTFKAA
jgi:probable addiction module antidote protein